jgi:hypothetical protein
MFHAAVRTRFPDKLPKGNKVAVTTSMGEVDPSSYDLLIDMRKLKSFH